MHNYDTLGRPQYCIFPLFFRHSKSRSSRFLLLCVLLLSSQPTPGSIQFFDSFLSHSQPYLFSFHCFPCAVISHPLDPNSVTLPSFQTSVVSPFFPAIFFQVCLWPPLVFHLQQRSIHSRIVQSRFYSRFPSHAGAPSIRSLASPSSSLFFFFSRPCRPSLPLSLSSRIPLL